MFPKSVWSLAAAVAVVCLSTAPADAGWLFGRRKPCDTCQNTPKALTCKNHTMQRAGYPNRVASYAIDPFCKHYSANWVGGGSPFFHTEPRTLHEGTWGLDYHRHILPINIWLKWNHGRKYQAGFGRYETDGPFPKVVFPLNKI